MSMKVPKIVEEAKQALDDGYCVVIGLQTTGEVSFVFYLLISQFYNFLKTIYRVSQKKIPTFENS